MVVRDHCCGFAAWALDGACAGTSQRRSLEEVLKPWRGVEVLKGRRSPEEALKPLEIVKALKKG